MVVPLKWLESLHSASAPELFLTQTPTEAVGSTIYTFVLELELDSNIYMTTAASWSIMLDCKPDVNF